MRYAPGCVLLAAVTLLEECCNIKIEMIDPGLTDCERWRRIDRRGELSGFRQAFHLLDQLIQARGWSRGSGRRRR